MNIRIRDNAGEAWAEPGPWFETISKLPQALRNFEVKKGPLKRILITSPSPTLFSFALAVGSSRFASDSNEDVSEKLDYGSIESGDLLKITFPWVVSFEQWL